MNEECGIGILCNLSIYRLNTTTVGPLHPYGKGSFVIVAGRYVYGKGWPSTLTALDSQCHNTWILSHTWPCLLQTLHRPMRQRSKIQSPGRPVQCGWGFPVPSASSLSPWRPYRASRGRGHCSVQRSEWIPSRTISMMYMHTDWAGIHIQNFLARNFM